MVQVGLEAIKGNGFTVVPLGTLSMIVLMRMGLDHSFSVNSLDNWNL